MIIDCISDLHGFFPKLDGGDLLIIAGDLTKSDRLDEYQKFDAWLRDQQYRKKVIVAGNHDNHLQNGYKIKYGDYLEDSGTEFDGFKIWGSPWTKRFEGQNPMCMAFSIPIGESVIEQEKEIKKKFSQIPLDTNILVTHSPPYCVMDKIEVDGIVIPGGSYSLFETICHLNDNNLKLHAFGHIHEGYMDKSPINKAYFPKVSFVNASHVNKWYEPVNSPVRIVL